MKKEIKVTYNVRPSKRPSWLLHFMAHITGLFCVIEADYTANSLENISNMLNEHTFTQRTLKRSCECMKREIEDNKISIYSSSGNTVLVTIEFV